MGFIKNIKRLTEINEVLSKTDLGNISKIRDNREMVIKYLTNFNFDGELISLANMKDDQFTELFNQNKKFVAGLKHTFGIVEVESLKDKRQGYVDILQKNSLISFDGKEIDLKNISNEEYTNLLKNKSFSQALVKHFKDKSTYRQVVLGKNEFVKNKDNKLSAKNFILNKNKIYSLMTILNNGKFKRTLVIDLDTKKPDNDINNLNLKINVDKCTELLNEYGYNKVMYEIGICYDKNKVMTSITKALSEIYADLNQKPDRVADANAIYKIKTNINNIYDEKYKIIFSIEPTLVVSQSSGVDWKSCMALIDDSYGLKNKASSSINAGMAVIYITKVGDLAIDRPLARFLVKVATLRGFEGNKSDKYHQFYIEKLYTANNMRSDISIPQSEGDKDSVLGKFGLKVKELIENVNKKRLKDLIATTDTEIDKENLTDDQKQKLKTLGKDQIEFKMSDDYYSDSGSVLTRNADYNFIEIAEKKEDFDEETVNRIMTALSMNRLNSSYIDQLFNLLIKDAKYKDLIIKLLNHIEEQNSDYVVKTDYSYVDDMNIDAYGDNVTLNSRASGREKANITANTITYKARDIKQGKNNLKNLKNYNITFRKSSSRFINSSKKQTIFSYRFNPLDKGEFTISDVFKFPANIENRSESNVVTQKTEKGKQQKINLNLKKSSDFEKQYTFSSIPGLTKTTDSKLEIKFDSNFNKNIEYYFDRCALKFDKKTEAKDSKNFKLFFKDNDSKILTYPNDFYITVAPEDSYKNQIQINFQILRKNIEDSQLKQIASNKELLNILKENDIVKNISDTELVFNDEAKKTKDLAIDKDLVIDGINIFDTYRLMVVSQTNLPKNIYFVLNISKSTDSYNSTDIYHLERIIRLCKIFKINYFVIINGQQEQIETLKDFDAAIFKYSGSSYQVDGSILKIYEKDLKTDYEEIRRVIKSEGIRSLEFIKLTGKSFDFNDINSDNKMGDRFDNISFFDVPDNFDIKIENYEGSIEFKSFNVSNLKLNIKGILPTRLARVNIQDSAINNLELIAENMYIKMTNSRVFINNKSQLSGKNTLRYDKSEFLIGDNVKVDEVRIDEADEINIPKNFTVMDFSVLSANKINNYENINWNYLFSSKMYTYPEFKVKLKDYSNFPIFIRKEKFAEIESFFKNKDNIILVDEGDSSVKFHRDSIEAMLKNVLEKANIKSVEKTTSFKEDASKFKKIYYSLPRLEDTAPFSKLNQYYMDFLDKSERRALDRKRKITSKNPIKTKMRRLYKDIVGDKKKKKKLPLNDSFISSIKRIDSKTYFD